MLISDNNKIVTAAHCCQGFTKPNALPFVKAILGRVQSFFSSLTQTYIFKVKVKLDLDRDTFKYKTLIVDNSRANMHVYAFTSEDRYFIQQKFRGKERKD